MNWKECEWTFVLTIGLLLGAGVGYGIGDGIGYEKGYIDATADGLSRGERCLYPHECIYDNPEFKTYHILQYSRNCPDSLSLDVKYKEWIPLIIDYNETEEDSCEIKIIFKKE